MHFHLSTISIHHEKHSDSNGHTFLHLCHDDERVLPYFLWFGLQILPMFIVLFSMVYCVCTIARGRHQVQMSESSQNSIHRSTAMICIVMMAFISGEFPTSLSYGFGKYGENSDNSFVQWLGFSDNGILMVNAILYISYFLNICVYVFMSKSFRERLLTIIKMM